MSTRKSKRITYHVIDDVRFDGLGWGHVNLACIPVGPEDIRGKSIGLSFKPEDLRTIAANLIKLCDRVLAEQAKGEP